MTQKLETEKIDSKCLNFLKKNELKLEMGKYQLILIQFFQTKFPLITKAVKYFYYDNNNDKEF